MWQSVNPCFGAWRDEGVLRQTRDSLWERLHYYRRLSTDYDDLPQLSEGIILIVMSHLMLQRSRR
jgi:hypothetical protein